MIASTRRKARSNPLPNPYDDELHPHRSGPAPASTDPKAFLDVAKRTSLLLTFGSPLDKTAYVFGTRGDNWVHASREALAASIQPLIQAQRFRSFPWINVYSPNDIISGRLNFYDLPNATNAHPVENVEDLNATTWLAAHTEYWTTTVVWKRLHEALTRPPPPADKAKESSA